MRWRTPTVIVPAAMVLAMLPAVVLAQGVKTGSLDVGLYAGAMSGDEVRTTLTIRGARTEAEIKDGGGGGLRLGYNFNPYLGIEGAAAFFTNDLALKVVGPPPRGVLPRVEADTTVFDGHVNLVVQEGKHILDGRLVPFATAGIGVITFSESPDVDGTRIRESNFAFNVGGGLKLFLTNSIALRVDARYYQVRLADTRDPFGLVQVTGGIFFSFGGKAGTP